MKRKIILASIALFAVLAAMGAYLYTNVGPGGNGSADADKNADHPTSTSAPDPRMMKPVADSRIGPSLNVSYTIYEPAKGGKDADPRNLRKLALFQADEARVVGPGKFHAVRPEIWNYMTDGQVLHLSADEGDFVAPEAARPTVTPRSGVLTGHVVIRLTRPRAAGQASPSTQSDRVDENIRIRMDRVEFDYSDNYVRTDSVVLMESNEADADVRGMEIRWDPVSRQITYLRWNTECDERPGVRLAYPGQMIVRGGVEVGRAGGASSQPGSADAGASRTRTAPPDPTRVQTYHAQFKRNVEMAQGYLPSALKGIEFPISKQDLIRQARDRGAADELLARLSQLDDGIYASDVGVSRFVCDVQTKLLSDDVVSMIFDFTPPAAGKSKAAKPKAATPAERPPVVVAARPIARGPAAAAAPATRPEHEEVYVVRWAGPLTMIPVERDERAKTLTGPNRRLIATGDNVAVLQKDGTSATGQYLRYDQQTMIAELKGGKDQLAHVRQPSGRREIDCQRLVFDQRNSRITVFDTLHFRGQADSTDMFASGKAASRPADEASRIVEIDCDKGAEILLATPVGVPRASSAGGPRMELLGKGAFSEAAFRGNVRMTQGDNRIWADSVTAYFAKPTAGVRANQIERVAALGEHKANGEFISQVRIVGSDTGGLRVGPAGQPARPAGPDLPVATTRPAQPYDVLCDRLALQMKLSPQGTAVPDKAVAAGHARATQDTTAVSAERLELLFGEKAAPGAATRPDQVRYTLSEMQAYRNVAVTDPARQLNATGSQMHFLLESSQATLIGNPAKAVINERTITGPIIEMAMDKKDLSLQALGKSSLAFKSDANFATGRKLDKPMPMEATSEFRMSYVGRDHVAELHGGVKVAFGGGMLSSGPGASWLNAETVKLYFEPTTAPDAGVPVATGTSKKRPPAWGPGSQPDDPLMAGMGKKRLREMHAETNVLLRTIEIDPATNHLLRRDEIVCQQLNFDNATNDLVANGAGRVKMEDYRPPEKKPAGGNGGLQAGGVRPSQTAIAFLQQMKFNSITRLMTFDGDPKDGSVRMRHRGPKGLTVHADGSIEIHEKVPETVLNCRMLTVQFAAAKRGTTQPAGGSPGGPADAAQDFRMVRADGDVYVEQENLRLLGDILEYQKDADTVLLGCEGGREAEIFRVAPNGSRFDHLSAPRIQWNRSTGAIKPFEGSFEGSSGR